MDNEFLDTELDKPTPQYNGYATFWERFGAALIDGIILFVVGQMILGEIEKIGGILTADPITQAEGDYNIEAGSLHQKANKNLTAIDEAEKKSSDES